MKKSTAPKILITGATGNVGRELIKQLSAQGVPFRVMVRSKKGPDELTALKRLEIVIGDFNDAKTIANAMNDMERAFFLTNSSEQAEIQQCRFVDSALDAGIQHIVKLSQWAADQNSPVRFLRYHAVVEKKIKESGIAYTFLRPNLFMQGLLAFRDSIVNQGKFFAAIGNAKISIVDVRNIAAVAAAALTEDGHTGKIYNITGLEALTHFEMAEKLSKVLGRQISFVDISPEMMRETLIGFGIPEWQAEGLIEEYAHYSRGEVSAIASGVQDATGKLPHSFEDFLRDYAPAFS